MAKMFDLCDKTAEQKTELVVAALNLLQTAYCGDTRLQNLLAMLNDHRLRIADLEDRVNTLEGS